MVINVIAFFWGCHNRLVSRSLFASLVLFLAATAAGEEALYRQEPFDRITLDEENGGVVLEVRPLDFPNRVVPSNPDPQEKILFHLIDQPFKSYEVPWGSVAKVELFEQILLAEARRLATSGKGTEAYDYFRHLSIRYPKLAGMEAAYNDFLYDEAKQRRRANDLPGAFAALGELHERDSRRAGLDKAVAGTADQMIQQYVSAQNYPAARKLLKNLAAWYPQESVVAKWESQLKQSAQRLLKEGKEALAAGDLRKADDAARRLVFVWPQLPGAKELAQSVHQKYPRVVVGVITLAAAMDPDRMDDWASRRCARLVHRGLAEFTNPVSQGSRYTCTCGDMRFDPKKQLLVVKFKSGQRWHGADAGVESYDAARRLAALLTPADPAYRADLAELLTGIESPDADRLTVTLAVPHLAPEALLRTMFLPYSAASAQHDPADANRFSNGPCYLDRSSETEAVFRIRDGASTSTFCPKEIVEQHFADAGTAATALRQGQIQLIDRINPWELSAWKGTKGIKVEAYGMPLVHCLVPNVKRPLMAQRTLRRALEIGINRESILRSLIGIKEVPGCQLISGPFPARLAESTDSLPAYDTTVAIRRLDLRLATILVRETLESLPEPRPKTIALVLAHPADPIARTACQAIRGDLQKAGVALQLRELPPGSSSRPADDVDLVYVELAMVEPLVDARRLLGDDGLAGACSPIMSLALRQAAESTDPAQARIRLRRVHRLCHDESAVIPLWQLIDHFACHQSLQGIEKGIVSLYQDLEKWNVEFTYPSP
jgi:hypothetical protein